MFKKPMLKLTGLGFMLLSSFANGQSFRLNCWDSTFSYNAIGVRQVSDGYEVTVQGSTLGSFLLFQDALRVVANPETMSGLTIRAKFPTDTCEVQGDKISCKLDGDRGRNSRLYVDLPSRHLGESRQVISDFEVQQIKLQTGDKVTLSFFQFDQQSMGFNAAECNNNEIASPGNTNWGASEFPQELRDYLSEQKTDAK